MDASQHSSIEDAKRLYQAILPQPLRLTDLMGDLAGALRAGERNILVELPWGERRAGERHDRHLVIIKRVADQRVFFVNALKNPDPVGATIAGPDRGPTRRVEPGGEESMPLEAFSALFAQGGRAMIAQGA